MADATKKQKEKYLNEIWTNPSHPGAFAGPDKLYQIMKKEGKFNIGHGFIKYFLSKKDAYGLHKARRKNFKRNRVIVEGIDSMWDGDLASMENVAQYNDGVKFLLVLIDIFSRFLIVRPLTNKKSETVTKALKNVFQNLSRRPRTIRFDNGGEFKSATKRYLNQQGIHVFYTNNAEKANYSEKAIQNLKNKIYAYFTEQDTYRYIDVLQDLIHSYNHTPHQSLGNIAPASVTKKEEDEIRYIQYLVREKKLKNKTGEQESSKKKRKPKSAFRFNVGDFVRISHLKKTFEKGYQEKWTMEYFKISKRFKRDNQDIYHLEDLLGEPVKGTFYKYELQKILTSENDVYRVEKVIKRRHLKGKQQEVLVKWMGWPDKFNSWVPETSVKQI